MATADAMSLMAKNATTQLLWDHSETQRFYLYTPATKTLILLTDLSAKNFYNTSASWQLPGSCAFGSTNVNWGSLISAIS